MPAHKRPCDLTNSTLTTPFVPVHTHHRFSDEKGESNYKILLDSLQGDGILTDGKDIPFMVAQ